MLYDLFRVKNCFYFHKNWKLTAKLYDSVSVITHFPPFRVESSPKSNFPHEKSIFPHFRNFILALTKIFFIVIKLTAVIQFLCQSKICWKWKLTILVMGENGLIAGKIWLGGTLNSKWENHPQYPAEWQKQLVFNVYSFKLNGSSINETLKRRVTLWFIRLESRHG